MSLKTAYIYTDEDLIRRFQLGDESAYIELVNRYRDKLHNFIYYFLGDIEQAEDIVQDTMIRLYEKNIITKKWLDSPHGFILLQEILLIAN